MFTVMASASIVRHTRTVPHPYGTWFMLPAASPFPRGWRLDGRQHEPGTVRQGTDENSWVTIDGYRMQSVAGGGHWGGGMFISSRDHARFGLLMLRDGRWGDRQLLSQEWLARARTPTPQQRTYGYMNWFLNADADHKRFASAPVGDVFFLGAGTNMIWLCPSRDMVVVVRWLEGRHVDAFIGKVLSAFA